MSSAATVAFALGAPRSGMAYWWQTFLAMLRWEVGSLRLRLPALAVIQVIAGAGFVVMMSLLVPGDLPQPVAQYLATGLCVLNLYMLGLMFGPQVLGERRTAGTYDAMQSLPAPRTASAAAWYVVSLLVGLPGMIVTLAVAGLRYHVEYAVSPAVIPATLLVTLAATMLGYALGHSVRSAIVGTMLSQSINIFSLGFTPMVFPPERLPGWLQAVNAGLPFEHLSALLRASLTADPVDQLPLSYTVVAAWTLAFALVAARAIGRRG